MNRKIRQTTINLLAIIYHNIEMLSSEILPEKFLSKIQFNFLQPLRLEYCGTRKPSKHLQNGWICNMIHKVNIIERILSRAC